MDFEVLDAKLSTAQKIRQNLNRYYSSDSGLSGGARIEEIDDIELAQMELDECVKKVLSRYPELSMNEAKEIVRKVYPIVKYKKPETYEFNKPFLEYEKKYPFDILKSDDNYPIVKYEEKYNVEEKYPTAVSDIQKSKMFTKKTAQMIRKPYETDIQKMKMFTKKTRKLNNKLQLFNKCLREFKLRHPGIKHKDAQQIVKRTIDYDRGDCDIKAQEQLIDQIIDDCDPFKPKPKKTKKVQFKTVKKVKKAKKTSLSSKKIDDLLQKMIKIDDEEQKKLLMDISKVSDLTKPKKAKKNKSAKSKSKSKAKSKKTTKKPKVTKKPKKATKKPKKKGGNIEELLKDYML